MKEATVYKRRDGWYLHAFSTTTTGVGLGSPPRIKLDMDATTANLGQAVLEALKGSQQGVPHPPPKEAVKSFKPMLDLAGVKTWAAFAKNASNVDVSSDANLLIFEPWKNAGPKGGFVPFPGEKVTVRADAPTAEIGEALKKAMALCPE
jgi:hypothetical protein